MKLLYIHDAKTGVFSCNDSYTSTLTDDFIKRYAEVSDETEFALRTFSMQKSQIPKRDLEYSFYKQTMITSIPNITAVKSYGKNIHVAKRIFEKSVFANDFIIVRLPSFNACLAMPYIYKFGKPYLIECVGCAWDSLWNYSVAGKIMAPYYYYLNKMHIKRSRYVIYVTSYFLQHRYPTEGESITCSNVTLDTFDKYILRRRIEKIDNMTQDRPIVLATSAAVDVRYKGQEDVIKAISYLNKKGYEFEYYLIGGGDRTYLQSIASQYDVLDKVHFLGFLSLRDVFDVLDEIDIYIQPSKTEGLPRAVIEAMSRGCPVIGSGTGGIPELINNDFVFSSGSVSGICDLLLKMDRSQMRIEAERNYYEVFKYNKETLDAKRKDFYRKAIDAYLL